jgi:hypothetical protein
VSLVGGWLLAPVALSISCVALGMLVEPLVGRVPGALLPPLGLAVLIVVAGILTRWSVTAEAAVPVVGLLSVLGIVVRAPWRDVRLRAAWPWPAVVALGAFAIFALPSLWSGQASITGYVKLDDSATWLAITEHVFHHGNDLSGLAPSSVSATLHAWLGGGYPTGAFMPLGVGSGLSGQDLANAYQPTIAVAGAILALGLFASARDLARSPRRAAACALIGVQASLFLGYTQWGGIKEAITAALLPPLAMFAVRGNVVGLGLSAGAMLDVLGVDGVAWAGPALLLCVLVVRRPAGLAIAAGTALIASLPALLSIEFVRQTTEGAITRGGDLGNLMRPPSLLQGAGLWPAGDFRVDPNPRWPAVVLSIAVIVAAVAAVVRAVRAGRWATPALGGIAVTGCVIAVAVGAPWVDAKALAIVSPIVLTSAATIVSGRAVALAALGGAMAWSTLLIARDVYVAPRARLSELRDVAHVVAGRGPTLVLDFEIYADRYFLREGDPEGASDLRTRRVRLVGGGVAPRLATVDVDDIATRDLWDYDSLVRRRTPVGSRPPSAFSRVYAGAAFEVWRRSTMAPQALARLPLGEPENPAAVPRCSAVAALAAKPQTRMLAAAPRAAPVVSDLSAAGIPPPWRTPTGIRPVVDGTAAVPVQVPAAGRWRVWVGGSALGRLEIRAGGRSLGVHRHELAHQGQWQRFGVASLPRGAAVIQLLYVRGARAGRGAPENQASLGPVALTSARDERPGRVIEAPPRAYREFCDGRRYDWIEALP